MKQLFLQHRNNLMIQYNKSDRNYIASFFMPSGGIIYNYLSCSVEELYNIIVHAKQRNVIIIVHAQQKQLYDFLGQLKRNVARINICFLEIISQAVFLVHVATCEQKASFLTFILHIVINFSPVSISDGILFNICLKSNVHLSHYNLSEGPIRKL